MKHTGLLFMAVVLLAAVAPSVGAQNEQEFADPGTAHLVFLAKLAPTAGANNGNTLVRIDELMRGSAEIS